MTRATPTPTANGPIFIVGYIHTGTSLLKSMLRRDPSLFTAAGETHFYQDLNRYRRQFADPASNRGRARQVRDRPGEG